ncbi:hypothetical protein D1BOALGB6SA_374 [Olavius sp. associated proteobacterium Delta 1]|nr:hypothetical protein D1BOALGB6SA_374 [Olavius sp. associated proteobacterium Delta 1]
MSNFFEFLLGHAPADWVGGRLSFGAPINVAVMIGALAAIIGAVWLVYRKTTVAAGGRLKVLLIALKSAVLAALLLCLLQPMLITSMPVVQQNDVAVIVDNSRSMTIRDMGDDRARGEVAVELLYGQNGLMDRLQDDFQLHAFRIDGGGHPISGPKDLKFAAARTSLAEGLAQISRTLKGLPISGLILISDGGDNSRQDPIRVAQNLAALDIPVFAVGVGQTAIPHDREITQVTAARTVMEESIFDVNVTIRNQGYAQREFDIIIEDGDRILARKTVQPGQSHAARRYTLELNSEDEGPRIYVVQIPAEEDESIVQNNRRAFLVDKVRKKSDVLYIEGHPRNEYKFIRRAVEGDQTLRLVTYLKTGPHKFLRQGIRSPQELANGFPAIKEDLYQHAAIVLGDIPKSFFSAEQLAMIRQFVSERGGGFLMLGGSSAFEENFIGSPVADILPVTLLNQAQLPPQLPERAGSEKFSLRLTAEGEHAAVLRLGLDRAMNRQLWEKMPQLQGFNATGPAKPGATVLAVHPTLRLRTEPLPVIAYERYGRGRSMVVATASTWRWQMLLPHEDRSHERFWRQVLRWLAAPAPLPVEMSLDKDSYGAGEQVNLRVRVSDAKYAPVNDATVWLKLTDSAGSIQDVLLEWAIDDDGIYTGAFKVHQDGIHKIEVAATSPSGKVQEASSHFLVVEPTAEFIDAGMDAVLLKAMAGVSGGKFYTANHADRLVSDLKRLQKVVAVDVEQDIWDMPIVLILLCGLLALEWLVRRRKGMS